ncbi:MAG TPA: ATP-dependent DNA ligase [Micromonospora sp.]
MLSPPVEPMRALAVGELPGAGATRWAYEPKFDGWRALAFVGNDEVLLQSRAGRMLARYFPDVCRHLLGQLPAGTVVDGELVAWSAEHGHTSFALLQRRVTAGRQRDAEVHAHPAHLVVFDLLQVAGTELLRQSLADRRAHLADLLVGGPPQLPLCPQTADRGEAWQWFTQWWRVGVEGLVIKNLAGAYRPGRADWLKLKRRTSVEAVVGGVVGAVDRPEMALLGRFDDAGRLRYAGRTAGLPPERARELGEVLPAVAWRGPPAGHPWPQPLPPGWAGRFDQPEPLPYTPVEPLVVVEVAADVARDGGRWRHPVRLLRVRLDVDVAEVPHHGSVA